jgi:hypothetical protein
MKFIDSLVKVSLCMVKDLFRLCTIDLEVIFSPSMSSTSLSFFSISLSLLISIFLSSIKSLKIIMRESEIKREIEIYHVEVSEGDDQIQKYTIYISSFFSVFGIIFSLDSSNNIIRI